MIEVILEYRDSCLHPVDAVSLDLISDIKAGEQVRAAITRPRNAKHHAKFYVLMTEVFHNQNQFATLECLINVVKIALGYCDQFKGMRGETITVPKSISYASMSQKSFEQFYDRVVELICEKILPGMKSSALEQRVFEILGGPTPDMMR
jgi:hypothetical protein